LRGTLPRNIFGSGWGHPEPTRECYKHIFINEEENCKQKKITTR
jgi:hypothetical protein